MNKKILPSLLIIILVAVIGFLVFHNVIYRRTTQENIQYVTLAGVKIKVELAITQTQQEMGLSGRSGLKEDEGMLFVFETPGKYPFWMKDMKFPIDIIWISEDKKIVYIKNNAKPEDFPNTYGPEQDAKYVLEVVSGFSEKNNLKVGDSVLFQ